MTMPDIIDEVDALHAKAKQADADLETADIEDSHAFLSISQRHHEFQDAMLNAWPAIRDRLREAERKASDVNDELKSVLADWNEVRSASGSKTNGGLVGHITELRRKAKAFDAVARGDVGIGCRPNSNDTMKRDWVAYQLTPPRRCSNDLLTAIEAAIAAKETK